ncbi:MAG TPA: DEAD/DEAH box helicase [Desulfosporosinus sp.]|nr:DEAD/DEAH box helicase [Desulfosporosinus sp.]
MSTLKLFDNHMELRCDFDEREKAKIIFGYKWDGDTKCWRYPINLETFLQIKQSFPELFIAEEIYQKFAEEEKRIQTQVAVDPNSEDYPHKALIEGMHVKNHPRDYQKTGVSFMLMHETCMLFDEMGCGKTFQAMMTAIARRQLGQIKRCLVVCPATLKGTWYREISKHTYEHGMVIDGTKKERASQLQAYIDNENILFLIVNYESLRVDGMPINFDMIIIDESVRIKNPKALQTKAVKKIKSKYRVGLSGYPVANKIEDIWSQIDWIRPGYLGNRWQFEDRYMLKQAVVLRPKAGETKPREFRQVVGYRNLKELHEKLTPLYIRRLKTDVLKDLPPKIHQVREVELHGEQMEMYARMKTEMRVMVEDLDETEVQAKARTILVQLLRLSQITGGFITDVGLKVPYWMKQNAKLNELDEVLEEIIESGHKCVLWSRFVPMVHKLYERYNSKYKAVYLTGSVPVKDRDQMIQDFQDNPDIKIFVGQIQSGGMGITLHSASYEVFVDKAFISPSNILQAEDRLHRLGQKNSVNIITLIAKNTVDMHWEALLEKKKHLAQQLIGDSPGWDWKKQDMLDILK